MDINRTISLSEFAYCVWSADCPAINQIFVPHTGKEENDDRAAYYGGRVTPQRKEYESADFIEGQTEYDYDAIEDGDLLANNVAELGRAIGKAGLAIITLFD